MRAFTKINRDWIGDIHYWYILHAKSLDHQSLPFRDKVPLQSFHESNEELMEKLQNRENQDVHPFNRDSCFSKLTESEEIDD